MLNKLAKSWLDLQCQMIPSVQRGLVALGQGAGDEIVPTACWPEEAGMSLELAAAAKLALAKSCAVVHGGDVAEGSSAPRAQGVACPLVVDGKLIGVVAVETNGALAQQRAVMQLLQWGASWLEFLVERETSAVTGRLLSVVEVIAAGLEQKRFAAAATSAATELARALACSRVAVGFVSGGRARVRALSHSARFEAGAAAVREIEAAMDEALDQDAAIAWPPGPDSTMRVARMHEALAAGSGSGSVCTVPFADDGRTIGAITIERDGDGGFDGPTIELCEAVATLVGPILETKRREDRALAVKAADSFAQLLRRLLGPRHVKLKLVTLAIAGAAAFLALATGDYRVSAPATVESAVRRVVASPRDGYLAVARVRAGDVVHEGQLLATLENQDLELERLKLTSEREQIRKEQREAFASGDRAKNRILKARLSQIDAQVDLVDAQLARSRMTAPFDGVVVTGDLSQSLGASVERGQTLFEIAPLDVHRIVVEVDERDVSSITVGQRGELRLASFADAPLPIEVERMTPISSAEGGRNFFRVETRLDAETEWLRPGMQGIAKINVEQRKLLWIWTHELVDWLHMRLWRWQP